MVKKSKNQIEQDLLTHIINLIEKNEIDHQKLCSKIRNYNDRYNAQRSILGLASGESVLTIPFIGASDFGFPLEAITIDNLVVREFKAKYSETPICKVRAIRKEEKEKSEPAEQYLDFKLKHKIPNFKLNKKRADRIKGIEGGYISKIINGEYKEWVKGSDKGYVFRDRNTDEYFMDEETGKPAVLAEGEIPPNTERMQVLGGEIERQIDWERKEVAYKEGRKYYKGVRYLVRHYEDVLWDFEQADTPFIEDLPWFSDKPEYTIHDLNKLKDSDVPKRVKEKIDELIESHVSKVQKQDGIIEPLELYEWWGSYDIDDDGYDEEIRVLLSKDYEILIGWEENEFGGEKPFFHHYLKEKKKKFEGEGIVEFLEGIRNQSDALINQNFNRRLLNDNPPILTGRESGYDPDMCEYGPSEIWPLDDERRITVLPLPKGESANMNDIEFLMGLSQKIYGGVSDYATGNTSEISKNQTATGIKAIIAQGNIMFSDIVEQDQIINAKEYLFMMEHLFPLDLEEVENESFIVIGQEDPFKSMSRTGLDFEMILEPVTTDLDEHPDVRYRKFIENYQLFLSSQEPLVLKDHDLRAKMVDEILKSAFKGELRTKGANQLRMEELQIKQMALRQEITEIAKIQNEREKQLKMQAAEQVGNQIGQEMAKIKAMAERENNERR